MRKITDTLQISRSNQYARGIEKKERYKPHPDDRKYLPLIQQIIDERPTYGYRRVTLLVNRFLREKGESSVLDPSGSGHKAICRG